MKGNRRRRGGKPIRKQQLNQVISYVNKQQQNKEIKFLQRQVAIVGNIDADGHLSSNILNAAQGDGDSERIGDRLLVRKITCKFILESGFVSVNVNPDGTTAVNQLYPQGFIARIIVFVDKQNAIGALDEIIIPYTSVETHNIMNGYDPDYKKTTAILHDQVYVCNPHAATNTTHFFMMSFTKKWKSGINVVFDQGTTTVISNAFKILVITNIDTAASNDVKPDMTYNIRFDYEDPN